LDFLRARCHGVGTSSSATIRDALAIAVPGDVVLVQPGTYAQFHATVGVTIRAAVPGTAVVDLNLTVLPPSCTGPCIAQESLTRLLPPPGQTVHIEGLAFASTSPPYFAVHQGVVSSGTVTFVKCTLRSNFLSALTVDQARLHRQDCTLECLGTGNGWPPLTANTSTISAVRCVFRASQTTASLPGPTVRLRSAMLAAATVQAMVGAVRLRVRTTRRRRRRQRLRP
jgi:hypothetical protein